MVSLGLQKLVDEMIHQEVHHFEPSDRPRKTLRAIKMPFVCAIKGSEETFWFHVRFDVIEGDLPFLIGLPSLRAMKANLNLHYNQLSLVVNGVLHKIDLTYYSSHLRLPKRCTGRHQRHIKKDNSRPSPRGNGEDYRRQGNRHYYVPTWSDDEENVECSVEDSNGMTREHKRSHLTNAELDKLHKELGHASYSWMKSFIKESRLWGVEMEQALKSTLENCACTLSTPPSPRPVCLLGTVAEGPQECILVDVVFFKGRPFLHCIDSITRWSETGYLRTRRLVDQVRVFKQTQLFRHGIPKTIRGYREFNRGEFAECCRSLDIKLIPSAANHHEGNSLVQRANRSIRSYFDKIKLAEPRQDLTDIVAVATFHENTDRGHNKSSSFELIYDRVPRLTTICNPILKGSIDDNIALARKRQISAALHARVRTATPVEVGEAVYVWRDNKVWAGPGSVVRVRQYGVDIAHGGLIKTADLHRIRQAPITQGRTGKESIDAEESDDEDAMGRSSTSLDTACSANDQSMPQLGRRHRRSEAELQAEENKQILEKLPLRRATRISQHHHSSPMPIKGTASQLKENDLEEDEQEGRQLSVEERREAYKKELGSWQENKAYVCVPEGGVPPNSSIIGSHVVYRRKPDGTAKARRVPWGHKDLEKNNSRGDAPSLDLDAMRLLISLAVQRFWVVRKMDVKNAYVQAKGFKRGVFVRPPKEEANRTDLWKLLVPAYGLTESGRLWYLTSYEALTGRFGLRQSRLEPSFYYKQDADESLMLIVQVDDYLYAGSSTTVGNFEAFL